VLSYQSAFQKGEALSEYAGGDGPMGAVPKLRAKLGLDWDLAGWGVGIDYRHVDGWFYGKPGEPCADSVFASKYTADCRVRAWGTVDLAISYSGIKNLSLALKLRNFADKAAPVDPGNVESGFNGSFHNPYGRNVQVGLSYKFR